LFAVEFCFSHDEQERPAHAASNAVLLRSAFGGSATLAAGHGDIDEIPSGHRHGWRSWVIGRIYLNYAVVSMMRCLSLLFPYLFGGASLTAHPISGRRASVSWS
jgi:hypothetical protein